MRVSRERADRECMFVASACKHVYHGHMFVWVMTSCVQWDVYMLHAIMLIYLP